MGLAIISANNSKNIDLTKTYQDTNYLILVGTSIPNNSTYNSSISFVIQTSNRFTLNNSGSSNTAYIYWEAKGFIS